LIPQYNHAGIFIILLYFANTRGSHAGLGILLVLWA
jgi:hypothetical protein